jgi:hypothetical protein
MKSLKLILAVVGGLMLMAFASCVKKVGKEAAKEQTDFRNNAFIQVYNATLGSSRNYVYVDAAAITGAALAYGGTFPSTPANFTLTAGFRELLIKDTLSTSTQAQQSFAETFQASNNYTIFTYDTSIAAKHKTVRNDIVVPTDTTSRIRFANFVYSPNPVPAVDIFSKRRNANVFTNVPVTEVTDYIPFDSRNSDTLIVRIAGSGTDLLNRVVSGTPPVTTFVPVQLILTPTRLRSYTVIFRGGWRTDLSSAATVRTLSLFSSN